MSYNDRTAMLDTITLQMETIEDSFEKAVARYEYPFADGADLEDMGQKARTIRARCCFWDDGADNATYDQHRELVDLLRNKELLEFTHPEYGVMKVMVEQVSVRHDDRERVAEVDITLVEKGRAECRPAAAEDVESAAEESFLDAQDEMMDGFEADARDELGSEAGGILSATLDAAQGVLEQFQDVSAAARGWLKEVDAFVSGVEGELLDIANPANGLISAVSYGVNLPGRVIGSLARCVERYAILYQSLESAPARFLDSIGTAGRDLESRLGFSKQVRCAVAAQAAVAAAAVYKADEQERRKLRRAEKTESFDATGAYTAPAAAGAVMNVPELEQSLAIVREMLREAIGCDRSMESLKTLALRLLSHVSVVKLERDKITRVRLDNVMPLHLVCLKYGLPYNYAERIHSINRIANPTFTDGEVSIYVR